MRIGEAREIALERCCCDLEIARAEVIVLSKKRNKLVMEAEDKYAIKSVLHQLETANKDLKNLAVKQRGLRRKRRDDGREIRSAFTQSGPVVMSRRGRFQLTVEHKGEKHVFLCPYSQLFKDDREIWTKKSGAGYKKSAKRSVPSYLIPHVWRDVADPWTVLEKSSAWAIYLLIQRAAEDHVYIHSGSYQLEGKRWIYGIGWDKGTFRMVTGNAGKNNVICLELVDSMDIAIHRDHSRPRIFIGASDGEVLRIPLYGWGGEPKIWSRKERRQVDRDYTSYERMAWHYLRNYEHNTVKESNRIHTSKLRVKKRGNLWRPT